MTVTIQIKIKISKVESVKCGTTAAPSESPGDLQETTPGPLTHPAESETHGGEGDSTFSLFFKTSSFIFVKQDEV